MGRRWRSLLVGLLLAITACSTASPEPSAVANVCSGDLPERTSPLDYPLAVLYVAGNDLPPVVDEVEWLGGDEPIATTAPRAIHLQRFTVLQARGQPEVSLRMTDGVGIAAWTVDALPLDGFRRGDLETGRVRWSEGSEPAEVVCVPIADGEWAIMAEITFADDAGRATYYWRLNVSEATSG